MNRVVLESSPVQHMMAENPNLWNINTMRPPSQQSSPFFPPTVFLPQHTMPNSSLSMSSWHEIQELPVSWSQLLMGGVAAEEDKRIMNPFLPKKFESNWEEQLIHQGSSSSILHDVKPENSAGSYGYGHHASDEFQAVKSTWSPMIPVSSPQSCVTSLSGNNMLDFSGKKAYGKHPHPDKSSECNSTATGGAAKKARVQSSSQSTFKVRKEKLGDRVTALHQLVSPFGKTDTASVLLEAIGYIRFLQSQIEALSLPYLNSGPVNIGQTQPLLNDNCLKRKGVSQQEGIEEPKNDLRSRGLCVVPISCTMQVGGDNGADYCAPAFGGEFRHI